MLTEIPLSISQMTADFQHFIRYTFICLIEKAIYPNSNGLLSKETFLHSQQHSSVFGFRNYLMFMEIIQIAHCGFSLHFLAHFMKTQIISVQYAYYLHVM
jgi:hypothetical protein